MEASVWERKVNVFLIGLVVVLVGQRLTDEELGLGVIGLVLVFVLAALALIPLAGFLESAVEELAELLGPFVGGLLHTTCSNIAELTIALSVLLSLSAENGPDIVLGSIAGVIIRNSLLFLGLATLFGCWRNGRMKFSAQNAGEYSTIFALAVIGLSLPTLGHYVLSGSQATLETRLSVALAGLLALTYLAYILFAVFHLGALDRSTKRARQRGRKGKPARDRRQRAEQQAQGAFLLQTQPDTQALFQQERAQAQEELEEEIEAEGGAAPVHAHIRLAREKRAAARERGKRRLLEGHRVLRGLLAGIVLIAATALVAMMSEAFAGSVERLLRLDAGLKDYDFFLGLILIPVLAGVVELYGSVGMARRNKMEITMAVTAGATIQMILLVVPVLVLVGYFTGHPLDLVFKPVEVVIFGGATFAFMLLSRDGESTLLEGVQLCALWLLVAVTTLIIAPA